MAMPTESNKSDSHTKTLRRGKIVGNRVKSGQMGKSQGPNGSPRTVTEQQQIAICAWKLNELIKC